MMAYSKKELLECVQREMQKRRENYPKWVAERRMKQVVADDQISKMYAVYKVIVSLPDDFIFAGQGE